MLPAFCCVTVEVFPEAASIGCQTSINLKQQQPQLASEHLYIHIPKQSFNCSTLKCLIHYFIYNILCFYKIYNGVMCLCKYISIY